MIEILLTDLKEDNFYEETLGTIERICDDYSIENHFGTLSMANQMVCDYLMSHSFLPVDVTFRIDNAEVSFEYSLQNGDFKFFAQSESNENTAFFVLNQLADEIMFSTDYDVITTTFHVKTKFAIQRAVQRERVISHFANF